MHADHSDDDVHGDDMHGDDMHGDVHGDDVHGDDVRGAVLAAAFEQHRPRLRAIAQRILGSTGDADDVVQEAWLRLGRTSGVEDLGRWLTTVVSRLCLDELRRRRARREDPHDPAAWPDAVASLASTGADPSQQAEDVNAVGGALMVVLDTLSPAERLVFVLQDLFGVPFDEVAVIVDRSPAAARQLASRARRRVRLGGGPRSVEPAQYAKVVAAFLAAARGGDLHALIALLDPQAVLRADLASIRLGAPGTLLGAESVAGRFVGGAQTARPALLDGEAGLVWVEAGVARIAFHFTFVGGQIAGIAMEAAPDPGRVEMLSVRGDPLPRRRPS